MKRLRTIWAPVAALLFGLSTMGSGAQGPKPRLAAAIESSAGRVALPGTRPGQAAFGKDQGGLDPGTAIRGITLVLSRSAAQQADLDNLLAAQQNTASPLYHQWLTPEQFAARFGVADADLAKITAWLQGQGFQVAGVARSRDRVVFDGTAGQVNAAFATELRRYGFPDRVHFAPNSDLSVPATLAPLVTTVTRLADFRAHRQLRLAPKALASPAFTTGQYGYHFLTPPDLATMYDVNSVYKAGFNGYGQSIAILGQTYISTGPITAFQAGIGQPTKAPNMVLVPDTGVNAINFEEDGDEGESQLDVEYAGGMAPGANVYFIYTGDNSNSGVFDSLAYAVDEDVAPVISGSYGLCETELQSATSFASAVNLLVQQANTQGQTVVFSSGDNGSTDCYGDADFQAAQRGALVADFPATVPVITAVGGTEMATGTFERTNTQYWATSTGTDVVSSLLSYAPEAVWNEDTLLDTAAAGGGGTSVLFGRPTWQAGAPGISTGTNRLVPDIALQASIESPGYLYCTSDAADLNGEGLDDSCSNGLRSSSNTYLLAGGTSFAAPVFAGLLAVLNQAKHATGQGNVNATLYALASNATTYAAAFHDVTSGTNACTAGATVCTTAGASAYAATAGYDEATGLGSIDFANLVKAWPTGAAAALEATTVNVTAATQSLTNGQTVTLQIQVLTQDSSRPGPTGTATITADGASVVEPLSNGEASFTYTAPATGIGSHTVTVTYSGDALNAPSQGSTILMVGDATPSGTFTIAAQPLSIAYNSIASTSFVLTPASGYTGTVVLSLSTPSSAPTICYELSNTNSAGFNVPLNTGAAVTGTLTIGEGTKCTTTASGSVVLRKGTTAARAELPAPPPARRWPEGVALAGLLLAGLAARRARRLPALLGIAVLAVLGLGLSGCGGNSGSSAMTPVIPTTQTVNVTLVGTDSVNTSIANSATFNLTIH